MRPQKLGRQELALLPLIGVLVNCPELVALLDPTERSTKLSVEREATLFHSNVLLPMLYPTDSRPETSMLFE
jgi:hypothetical protein